MSAPDSIALLLASCAAPIGLAANVAASVGLGRLSLSLGPVRRQFAAFGFGALLALAWLVRWLPATGLAPIDIAGHSLLQLAAYAGLGFLFFNVINLNVSSLRIRMLKEYLRVHPTPLPESVLRARYSARSMLEARLERLAHGGQLAQVDGRYVHRPGAVTAIGHFFAFLQRLLLRR
jgi:hypothetical protein